MEKTNTVEIAKGLNSDIRPLEVEDLGSGRYDYNTNITQVTVTDEQTKKSRTAYTFDRYRVSSLAMTQGEVVNALVRSRYNESEEFSLLRQKETKPEEYNSYNAYCENCKVLGKTIWNKIHA